MSTDKDKQPYKCIYNLSLAGYLMMHKQPIQRIEKNLDRPWRNVYLFNASKEIEKLIEQYKSEKSKEVLNNGINNEKCKNNTKWKNDIVL